MNVLRWPVILLCALLSGVAARAQDTSYLDYSIPPNAEKIGPHDVRGFAGQHLTGINYVIPSNSKDPLFPRVLVGRETFDNGVLIHRELFLPNPRDIYEKKHGVQREWYPNGQLKSEEPYRNGVMHGVFKTWSEKGALIGQSTIVEGTGKVEVYNEEGVLNKEINYQGNQKNGLFVSRLDYRWSDDHRISLVWYKNGERVGIAYGFYEHGTLSGMNFAAKRGSYVGPAIHFDKSGAVETVKWLLVQRGSQQTVTEAEYAQAAALDPTLPPYYHEPDKYKELVSPEVRALVKHYQEMRVKIPLEFGLDGKPILARQP
ncbi:MORN variant repeat protein [Chthoniobacter flavus Ellin428]|uniref:MORN variant repeat protein n=2 Tax=Chthoniobacter flavus TaxID=191863 RepID=B4DC46_9BACT|nr:hypothetical protein [Chthoniobacter flavus]EDY15968.1 MORN variant repeat protein [Chthoniobacter flavus Ellin428]TCO83282.1 antitoxin component YwqK of YwqJK toxin-antitoxin module [Chthoniobacter flavus]